MAATNPSYYQSGVCQDIKQKEHLFHLYMNQIFEGNPNANQKVIVSPGLPAGFGVIVTNDWDIRDGPAATANLVARAAGMQIGAGIAVENWLFCHNILFTDTRFKGSSLKVLGDFASSNDSQWAIVGGTGEFIYAQGGVVAKIIKNTPLERTWELHISAYCLCIPKVTPVTKMGPWGGDGGSSFDITELPRSLQTVTIRCGDVINSVMFSYTDQAGQKKTVGPWGGDGALTATITLAPSEFIKQVLGTTGTVGGEIVVTSITLVSSFTTYGPFGKANGTPFSSQVPDGNNIGGFYVRAGGSVNALGVYACPI